MVNDEVKEVQGVAHEKEEEKAKKKSFKLPIMLTLMISIFTASAFATGGDSSDMTTLVNSLDVVTSLVGKIWSLILANPMLTLFMAVSLLFIGVRVFAALKDSARN